MHRKITPKRISITEMVTTDTRWNDYSRFHDSFSEQLSYENRKLFGSDIWQLNYI